MDTDKKSHSKNMNCVHIAICDDNKVDRKKYTSWIETSAKRNQIDVSVVCYESANSFLFQLEDMEYLPDIIYMDIHMPQMDGMELSKILREDNQNVIFKGELIFLTCDEKYVMDAFDVNAFHYIIKEVAPKEKFEEIFMRAIQRILGQKKKKLLLRGVGEYRNIDIDKIIYFEVFRRIITVHYGEPEETFEFYSAMNKLEEMVSPFGFLRVQRSFILRVGAILSLKKTKAIMKNGSAIPVGDAYYSNVQMAFERISI